MHHNRRAGEAILQKKKAINLNNDAIAISTKNTQKVALVALVAHVLLLTPYFLGLQTRNWFPQIGWPATIGGQYLLLSLYLGLGSGTIWKRFIVAFVGMTCITFCLVWAVHGSDFDTAQFWREFHFWSVLFMLPMLALVAAMLPLRAILGRIQCGNTAATRHQFRILDIILLTLIVAFATVWATSLGPRFSYDAIRWWAVRYAFMFIDVLAVANVILGQRFRLISLLVLGSSITASQFVFLGKIPSEQIHNMCQWLVVISTLVLFRIAGFRLIGSNLNGRDQMRPSPKIPDELE